MDSPEGYQCTLSKGHKGKHIACGIDIHNYAIWEDKSQC